MVSLTQRRLADPAAVIAGLPPDRRPLPTVFRWGRWRAGSTCTCRGACPRRAPNCGAAPRGRNRRVRRCARNLCSRAGRRTPVAQSRQCKTPGSDRAESTARDTTPAMRVEHPVPDAGTSGPDLVLPEPDRADRLIGGALSDDEGIADAVAHPRVLQRDPVPGLTRGRLGRKRGDLRDEGVPTCGQYQREVVVAERTKRKRPSVEGRHRAWPDRSHHRPIPHAARSVPQLK